MASAFSHVIVAVAMGRVFQNKELSWLELFLGALCSVVPDLDVIGFYFGIQYGDVWGHRGLTHSLVFAALFSGGLVALWYRGKPAVAMTGLFLYFFLCTASHGVLDAMTNGGLGVAFFSPFDTTRYFLPLATGPRVSNRDQRILQRIRCSGPGQRGCMDLVPILRGVRGALRSPAALVSQVSGIPLTAIVRSRSSDRPCRLTPTSRTASEE